MVKNCQKRSKKIHFLSKKNQFFHGLFFLNQSKAGVAAGLFVVRNLSLITQIKKRHKINHGFHGFLRLRSGQVTQIFKKIFFSVMVSPAITMAGFFFCHCEVASLPWQSRFVTSSAALLCHPERGIAESKGLLKTDFSTPLRFSRNDALSK